MGAWTDMRNALRRVVVETLNAKEEEFGSLAVAGPKTVQHLGWSLDAFKVEVVKMVDEEMKRREEGSRP